MRVQIGAGTCLAASHTGLRNMGVKRGSKRSQSAHELRIKRVRIEDTVCDCDGRGVHHAGHCDRQSATLRCLDGWEVLGIEWPGDAPRLHMYRGHEGSMAGEGLGQEYGVTTCSLSAITIRVPYAIPYRPLDPPTSPVSWLFSHAYCCTTWFERAIDPLPILVLVKRGRDRQVPRQKGNHTTRNQQVTFFSFSTHAHFPH